jgi:hypothetical protein
VEPKRDRGNHARPVPAGAEYRTFFETYFGLAKDGKVGKNGLPNPLQIMVLARAYHDE